MSAGEATAIERSGSELHSSGSIASTIVAFLPLVVGLGVIALLSQNYNETKHAVSWINVHTWPAMRYAPLNDFAILYMMLVSNAVVVALGTLVYIVEIWRGLDPAEVGRSHLISAMLLGVLGGVVVIGWAAFLFFSNFLALYGGDASKLSWMTLILNDAFIIGVFGCFGLADIFLAYGYHRDLKNCEDNNYSERQKGIFEEKQRYALNCIWFIDVPVIIGSVVLFILTEFVLPKYGQLTPAAVSIFDHDKVSIVSLMSLTHLSVNTFTAGFILGAVICQLAYSQIVFTALNVKLSLATS